MRKKKTGILTALLSLGLAGAMLLSGCSKKSPDQVYVDGIGYPAKAESLDLRGSGISMAHFEALSGLLPECRILWDVPFQGSTLPSDSETITVTKLTEEDAELLAYFPNLRELDASGCRDYAVIMELLEKRPRCHVIYDVEIGPQTLPRDTKTIHLSSGESSGEELLERLAYLPDLEEVTLEEPVIPAEDLDRLLQAYPEIDFSWNKTAFGKKYPSSTEFMDVSGMKFSSLEEVSQQAAYFPDLKQLDMLNSGFSNDEMRAFRDQVRDRYKVVFNVQVGTMDLRTDVKTFFPDRDHGKVRNPDTVNLKYCEDLICVDVGHLGFSNVDWVEGTPHLKYLIMSDGGAQDITPLGQLQELEFLELFMTGVSDVSTLVNCKALRDLNLSRAPLGDITPLTQMPWLEKLWVTHCPLDRREQELLKTSLPNTHIEFNEFFSTWGGWRDMPRYFDMRDVLEMPYMR